MVVGVQGVARIVWVVMMMMVVMQVMVIVVQVVVLGSLIVPKVLMLMIIVVVVREMCMCEFRGIRLKVQAHGSHIQTHPRRHAQVHPDIPFLMSMRMRLFLVIMNPMIMAMFLIMQRLPMCMYMWV